MIFHLRSFVMYLLSFDLPRPALWFYFIERDNFGKDAPKY
jgi:hypothetical protein